MLRSRLAAPLLAAAFALAPSVASAQTFGGYLMTLSNNLACIGDANCGTIGTNQVSISNGVLTLVNGTYSTTGTAFTTNALNLTPTSLWMASFGFSMAYAGFDPHADGFAFVLQSVGANATGSGGGGIGISGLQNSAAVGFRSWDNNDLFVSTNGNFGSSVAHSDWGSAPLVTGVVTLSYNGLGMIDISMTSSLGDNYQGQQAFDMSGLTAGSVYMGFTAGTGLSTSTTTIDNLQFSSTTVPEPGSVALVGFGVLAIGGLAARRRRTV